MTAARTMRSERSESEQLNAGTRRAAHGTRAPIELTDVGNPTRLSSGAPRMPRAAPRDRDPMQRNVKHKETPKGAKAPTGPIAQRGQVHGTTRSEHGRTARTHVRHGGGLYSSQRWEERRSLSSSTRGHDETKPCTQGHVGTRDGDRP